MINIFSDMFSTATRTDTRRRHALPGHWSRSERFDNRRSAEIEAHNVARRRV
jgi:hypothetical protein